MKKLRITISCIFTLMCLNSCFLSDLSYFEGNQKLNKLGREIPHFESFEDSIFKNSAHFLKYYPSKTLTDNIQENEVSKRFFSLFKDPLRLHFTMMLPNGYMGVMASSGVEDLVGSVFDYPKGWVLLSFNSKGEMTDYINIEVMDKSFKEVTDCEVYKDEIAQTITFSKPGHMGSLIDFRKKKYRYVFGENGKFIKI
ncbi:hypothetical protein [Flammeovirga aprica]|uniref:Lipoprotein n=1 Tax=Flammeovirga aprica JL-4 TaxID=694437 RepID=A0A7X9S1Z3_9BACT|nr:hypothetical protein [Flammeovirga aprica]NME72919.1 hypothetical protein [Flammeovirga aprica JL-4]